MGFLGLCLAGLGLALTGGWEAAFVSAASSPSRTKKQIPPSSVTHLLASVISFLVIVNASISALGCSRCSDRLGTPLQLQIIAVASLFLLYSLSGILATKFTHLLPLPPSLLDLIALFAFGQEFLLYYLQRKDPTGLENRYYDLLLVPISICFVCTVLAMKSPKSAFPRLGRAVGLVLQGTWFVQMGFSFYTTLVANGCVLSEKRKGNYTVKCNGHANTHRSMAIATLQFNCHLAVLVILIVGVYWLFGFSARDPRDYSSYKPISAELRQMENSGQFTLESDDEDHITEEESGTNHDVAIPVQGMNGFGRH